MSGFLEKLRSLNVLKAQSHEAVTISPSQTASQCNSGQTCKLDKDSGTPIIAPLDTLKEVLSWQPGLDEFCVGTIPLRGCGETGCRSGSQLMEDPLAQKMVVCHDMMGGYNKDRFVQGHKGIEDYYFYSWQNVAAFIYFSHHFITLPPPCWTNAAHRHGSLSLGTVITEWKDGAKLCHSLLSNEFAVMQFSQQLVAIAQYYHFDGWLVNIENPIHPSLLDRLYMLLSLLTTGMHDACPGSKVIWYDSVTVNGELKWQNSLNHLNRPYFDMCDGIFLNYNWTREGLASSCALADSSPGKVYVGIDVFGRGCFGGGGLNSHRALEVITEQSLSAALFAPGWVFETLNKDDFFQNQNRFWSSLSPYCPTSVLCGLPLVSSFGQGCGRLMAIDGKVVYVGEWGNISAQDLQPSFTNDMIKNDPQSAVRIESCAVDMSSPYYNGACLKLKGLVKAVSGMSKPAIVRLFKTHVSLSSPILVSYTFKCSPAEPKDLKLFLQLHTTGSPARVFLDPTATTQSNQGKEEILLSGCGLPRSCDVPHLPGCVLAPLPHTHTAVLHEIFTGSSQPADTWRTSYFVVDGEELRQCSVSEVSLGFYWRGKAPTVTTQSGGEQAFSLCIGEIKVLSTETISPTFDPSTIDSLRCQDVTFSDDKSSVSLTLSWSVSNNQADPVDHCNIYSACIIQSGQDSQCEDEKWKSEFVYLGRAYTNCYRATGLFLLGSDAEDSAFSFEFRVQPVSASRRKPSVENSDCIVVRITVQ